MTRSRHFSERETHGIQQCNFSYFAAVMVPFAGAEELAMICDWGNWIFPFDDMFDNGDLRGDEARATKLMQLLHLTFSTEVDERMIAHISKDLPRQLCERARLHENIYGAIAAHCSPGKQVSGHRHLLHASCTTD